MYLLQTTESEYHQYNYNWWTNVWYRFHTLCKAFYKTNVFVTKGCFEHGFGVRPWSWVCVRWHSLWIVRAFHGLALVRLAPRRRRCEVSAALSVAHLGPRGGCMRRAGAVPSASVRCSDSTRRHAPASSTRRCRHHHQVALGNLFVCVCVCLVLLSRIAVCRVRLRDLVPFRLNLRRCRRFVWSGAVWRDRRSFSVASAANPRNWPRYTYTSHGRLWRCFRDTREPEPRASFHGCPCVEFRVQKWSRRSTVGLGSTCRRLASDWRSVDCILVRLRPAWFARLFIRSCHRRNEPRVSKRRSLWSARMTTLSLTDAPGREPPPCPWLVARRHWDGGGGAANCSTDCPWLVLRRTNSTRNKQRPPAYRERRRLFLPDARDTLLSDVSLVDLHWIRISVFKSWTDNLERCFIFACSLWEQFLFCTSNAADIPRFGISSMSEFDLLQLINQK